MLRRSRARTSSKPSAAASVSASSVVGNRRSSGGANYVTTPHRNNSSNSGRPRKQGLNNKLRARAGGRCVGRGRWSTVRPSSLCWSWGASGWCPGPYHPRRRQWSPAGRLRPRCPRVQTAAGPGGWSPVPAAGCCGGRVRTGRRSRHMARGLKEENLRLRVLLDEAAMSNKGLARRVVDLAAPRGLASVRCDHTSVLRWLAGEQPRPPVPELVAEVPSNALGRKVSETELGMTPSRPARRPRPAAPHRLDGNRSHLNRSLEGRRAAKAIPGQRGFHLRRAARVRRAKHVANEHADLAHLIGLRRERRALPNDWWFRWHPVITFRAA